MDSPPRALKVKAPLFLMGSEGQRKGWWLVRLIRSVIDIKDRTYSCTFALVSVNMWVYSGNLTHHPTSQSLQGSTFSLRKTASVLLLAYKEENFFWFPMICLPLSLDSSSWSFLALLLQTYWILPSSSNVPNSHQLLPQPPAFLAPTFHWPTLFLLVSQL